MPVNLGDSLLGAMKFAAGGEQEVQDRALRKQTLAANQRVLNKQRDKEIAGVISGTELAQFVTKGDPSDRTKPLYSFDVVGAYEKSPEATTQFLNTVNSSLLNATDEKGNAINVKVSGIKRLTPEELGKAGAAAADQDMFAITVSRPDGKPGVITRRGTTAKDDDVILMTRDELNGLATQRLTSMRNNGAFDNGSEFERSMADLQDAIGAQNAAKEQALRDEVDLLLQTDEEFGTAEKRELFTMFSRLEGEELLQAVSDFGIDVDSVLAEFRTKQETADTEEFSSEREKFVVDRRAGEAEMWNKLGNKVGEASSVLAKNLPSWRSMMGTPTPTADAPPRDANAPTLSDVQKRIDGTDAPRSDYSHADLMRRRALGTDPVDTTQSSVSPEIQNAPDGVQEAVLNDALPPEVRKQAILDAVGAGLAQPTGKQVEYVRDYMVSKGYKSPESLSGAPPEEIMNIAFTLAGAAAGDLNTADRMAIASSVMNFAQFGDASMSSKDATTLRLQAAKLRQDADESAVAKGDKQLAAWSKANEKAQELAETIRASIPAKGKKGTVRGAPASEGKLAMKSLFNRSKVEKDPAAKRAYEDQIATLMPEFMAASIIGEDRANLTDWITGPAQDWFTRAPYRSMQTDFGSFRLMYNDKGKPWAVELVTPKGTAAENGIVNYTQLEQMLGKELRDFFVSTIEKVDPELQQPQ